MKKAQEKHLQFILKEFKRLTDPKYRAGQKEHGGDLFLKKEMIITFDIYQDKIDNQNPDFTIYCDDVPDNPNSFSVEELQKSGIKKMIKLTGERKEYAGKLARKYIYRISEEKIKELLKHN